MDFKTHIIKNFVPKGYVVLIKEKYLHNCLNNISFIANHTVNNWRERNLNEKIQDIFQGKLAEIVFKYLLITLNKDIDFLFYDDFRNDNFQLSAPFDALIFQKGNPFIQQGLNKITDLIKEHINNNNAFQYLDDATWQYLYNKQIYSMEIKCSKVHYKDYAEKKYNYYDRQYYEQILNNIYRNKEYFMRPKLIRNKGDIIHNKYDYFTYIKNNFNKNKEQILIEENKNLPNLHTRVFFKIEPDLKNPNQSIYIFFIYGLINSDKFIKYFDLKTFPSIRSNNALFLTAPIQDGISLQNFLPNYQQYLINQQQILNNTKQNITNIL